ncbi:MAG: UDP-N-acetylmuramoyl-tripeptide--D-alanyl-D-alanine ligase [Alphaproteobacteria bacterium]|nr:UDP-N-acetylmuramoyl-tripeptide--D-alanyl-D-alanine ligase [Alphaproteobacteria bacterium]
MEIDDLYQIYLKYPQVFTDTRRIIKNGIYFALKGEHFNGNDYALEALEKGAAWAVVDSPNLINAPHCYYVTDVLKTLQNLSKYHRQKFKIPFIAITGSNGKTTTKELIAAVLKTTFKIHFTQGNLNNHIGIPLTLLATPLDCELAIIEMGANHQLEIADYCNYVMPTHGIITNCGKAHLEGFGSEEGVKKGKGELFDFLTSHDGTAFVNSAEKYLVDMAKNIKSLVYYQNQQNTVFAQLISAHPTLNIKLSIDSNIIDIQTHLAGSYNLANLATAGAIGHFFKVPTLKIKEALEHYMPVNQRSQVVSWHSNTVLLDAYNANPSSMQVAIENFATIHHPKKVLCLGAMKELGIAKELEHVHLIHTVQKYSWHWVALVGEEFKNLPHPFAYFNSIDDLKTYLKTEPLEHSYILLKGSRSTHMDTLIQ